MVQEIYIESTCVLFSGSENDTYAIMNDIVYIDHMKIADVRASPS